MKNVPDELIRHLRGAPSDLPPPGNSRWGKVARLATGTQVDQTNKHGRLTFVQTEIISPTPIPIAIRMRFSLDGQTYTPNVPSTAGGNVIVKLIETIDMKSGAFLESFTLAPGDVLPLCAILACALNLSVELDGEDVALFVEVVAAPTTMIDCADIVGPINATTTLKPFPDALVARISTAILPVSFSANALRAYLTVANQSTVASLFLMLGTGTVSATPGAELATIVLPPSSFAGYEVLNFNGPFQMVWDLADAAGYALVTQGLYPP